MYRFIKTLFYIFSIILLVVVAGGSYFVKTCFDSKNLKEQTVLIEKGSSLKSVSRTLQSRGIIKNSLVFEIYVRFNNWQKEIKAGEYVFKEGLSLKDTVSEIRKGQVKLFQFTIPEGYNIHQFCEVMLKELLMTAEDCQMQVRRIDLIHQNDFGGLKNPKVETLEGYLFPETYSYDKSSTPDQITKMMVDHLYKKLTEERLIRAKELGLTVYELLTFASIVEKETGVSEERPLVASVFHNRLKKGMLLQTDPTVIYGIKNYDGNIRRSDLQRDHPYNTYTRPGLPVGPIANPGLASIDAVLYPAETSYLYFVAKGQTGQHYFSKTLSEHNRAVQYYQLGHGSEPN